MALVSSCVRRPKQDLAKLQHNQEKAYTISKQYFDQQPQSTPVSYLYAPGFTGTELIMARYCPCFVASTGEYITCTQGGHTIGQPHSAVCFPEIDLRKPDYFTLNPLTAYINRTKQDLLPLGIRFLRESLGATVQDNPTSSKSVLSYSIRFSKANIGQEPDIKALRKAYRKHLQQFPDRDIVMYGDSRGASTIFSFLAQEKPQQVRAAILEGMFDSIPHIIKHFIYLDKEARTEQRMNNILSFVMGSYKPTNTCPRTTVSTITDDVPLLLITSLKDGLCSTQGVFYLYRKLLDKGHKKVHLLVLQHSYHPLYIIGNQEDKITYESCVHAFYQHYNLPHNKAQADAGKTIFATTQPTNAQLNERYPLAQCSMCP